MKQAKTRWLRAVALCLLFLPAGIWAQETQWEELNSAGMEAYECGDYAEAEKLWLAALKKAESFGGDDPRLKGEETAPPLSRCHALGYCGRLKTDGTKTCPQARLQTVESTEAEAAD